MKAKIEADDLVELLAKCKTGSSWNGARRLDAWAMPKSWSPLTTIGYEVKVARQDFLRDTKWPTYLNAVHELWFVCPKALIDPSELPANVGLLWATGRHLVTKRKAVRQAPDPQKVVELMAYVLMSRSRVVANMHEANRAGALAFWRAWLEGKAERQTVGHASSRRLRELVAEAKRETQKARADAERLQAVRETLEALGFEGDASAWTVKRSVGRDGLLAALHQIDGLAGSIRRIVEREEGACSTS